MKVKDVYLIFGTLCWLISLTSIVFNYPRKLKLFSLFLFISIASEWVAWYMARRLHKPNLWIYNLYNILLFTFLPYLYLVTIRSARMKRLIISFIILYPLLVLLNTVFVQGIGIFQTYTYFTGSGFMIFLIIYFFKELLSSKEYIIITKEPMFFISAGYLLFFTIEIPYTLLLPYFTSNKSLGMSFLWVLKVLNIIMYIFLSVSFLCMRKPKKY